MGVSAAEDSAGYQRQRSNPIGNEPCLVDFLCLAFGIFYHLVGSLPGLTTKISRLCLGLGYDVAGGSTSDIRFLATEAFAAIPPGKKSDADGGYDEE